MGLGAKFHYYDGHKSFWVIFYRFTHQVWIQCMNLYKKMVVIACPLLLNPDLIYGFPISKSRTAFSGLLKVAFFSTVWSIIKKTLSSKYSSSAIQPFFQKFILHKYYSKLISMKFRGEIKSCLLQLMDCLSSSEKVQNHWHHY